MRPKVAEDSRFQYHSGVTPSRLAELLNPYIVGLALPAGIYDQISAYLDLLLRWNAKTNLTAIRDPEQMVTRHFGESLFAAGVLFGEKPPNQGMTLADLGSGAGFPGVPIKLAFPGLNVTLIESQNKKASFLKEVIRALGQDGIEVYNGRAEQWGKQADVVTLRAVERFEATLTIAATLVRPAGRLCLLIGTGSKTALETMPNLEVEVVHPIPPRDDSAVVVGRIRH